MLKFKLLDLLPQAIKDPCQRVRLIIADLDNQGVEPVYKSMVVSNSLRDGQSQLVENFASFSRAHLSTPFHYASKAWRMREMMCNLTRTWCVPNDWRGTTDSPRGDRDWLD